MYKTRRPGKPIIDRRVDGIIDIIDFFSVSLSHKTDSVLPCICSVVGHRETWYENHESHTRLTARLSQMFLPHFDAVCVVFLNRRTTTRNLKKINILMEIKKNIQKTNLCYSVDRVFGTFKSFSCFLWFSLALVAFPCYSIN